jgi:hypothetical protein
VKKAKTKALLWVVVAVAMISATVWFQPWRLFTTVEVVETIPTANSTESQTSDENSSEPSESETALAEPTLLLQGELIDHEHETTGLVQVLLMPDGSRLLRIEGLETSDGPELEVWLTDAPVLEGRDGWHVFDDGEYLSLGALKGNVGDQNYLIPEGVDLDSFSSVSIWCVRFNVSFGAAALS